MDARTPRDLRALAWLIALVGIGSLLFHTVGQVWTSTLDVGFIAAFVILYLQRALVRLHGWHDPAALVAVSGMLLMSIGIAYAGRPRPERHRDLSWTVAHPGGPGAELPPARGGSMAPARRRALCRLDRAAQRRSRALRGIPLGTHFGWHLVNAVVLWSCVRALLAADGTTS